MSTYQGNTGAQTPPVLHSVTLNQIIRIISRLNNFLFDFSPKWMKGSNIRRWVLWRYEYNGEGNKPKKVPYYANGIKRNGKLETERDWEQLASFDEARSVYDKGGYDGLGFALGKDNNGGYWQGVDCDQVIDKPWLFNLLLPGYVEGSPSKSGAHVIGYGRQFDALGSNGSGIEAYSTGRYFTVTGWGGELITGIPVSDNPICIASYVESVLKPLHKLHRETSKKGEAKIASLSSIGAESPIPLPPTTPLLCLTTEQMADLYSALSVIPADDGAVWVAVGQALCKIEGGWVIFDEWSKTCSAKYDYDKNLKRWNSFTGDHTGYAAIFKRAEEYGWVNPSKRVMPHPDTLGFGDDPLPPGASLVPIYPIPPPPANDLEWEIVSIGDTLINRPKRPQFIIGNWLPENDLTIMTGNGGSGKTTLMLQAAICIAMGMDFLGNRTMPSRVIFFSGEDGAEITRYRTDKICKHMNVDPQSVAQNLIVINASDNPTLYEENSKQARVTAGYEKLRAYIKSSNAKVVILDNASDTFNANENIRQFVREFLRSLKNLKITVLLLAHVNKETAQGTRGTQNYTGSSAWHNSSRSRWFLEDSNGVLTLKHEKLNCGKCAAPIALQWSADGVLILKTSDPFQEQAQDDAVLIVLLTLIHSRYTKDRFISPASTSRTNAFSTLKNERLFPKTLTTGKTQALLERAEDEELLMREPNKRDTERWKLTEKAINMIALPPANTTGSNL